MLNLDSEEHADLEINFRGDPGTPLSFQLGQATVDGHLQLSIPPSGMRILRTDGSGPVIGACADAASSQSLAGVLVFGGDFGLAGVGSGEQLRDFAAPMESISSARINTGIAIMNLEATQVILDLQLKGLEGEELATASMTLPGQGHKAVFVNQFDWSPTVNLSSFQGVIEATATGKIAVRVLQTRPGQYATMPVVAR